jgi:hypothetical protein
MDDNELEKATIRIQDLVMDLIEEGLSPLAVAGVVQASATKMYRAILEDEEFEDLMQTVVDSSKKIENKTFH